MAFWKSQSSAPLTEISRVIVNIWLPRVNDEIATSLHFIKSLEAKKLDPTKLNRIGHVSIETPNQYASWWPAPDANRVKIFNVVKAANSTYADDCSPGGEGTVPDLRICLYSLDVQAIEDCFEHVENSDYGYVLAGDKKTVRLFNTEKGQSCCGLAYELLAAGGILDLSQIHQDLKLKYIVVTPENFSEFMQNTKQAESKKFPETDGFSKIEYEYRSVSSSACVLV